MPPVPPPDSHAPMPPVAFTPSDPRPPPPGYLPTGPPPRYTAMVTKVYPYSLRPILIFTSFLGCIWALVMGVNSIKDRSAANETSREKTFDLVLAILFFVVAAIEAFGIVVGLMQSLPLGRLLAIAAPVAIVVNFGAQLINVITHFTLKSDLINQCVANTVGETTGDDFGDTSTVSTSQATSWCNDAWNRGTWTVFAWLIVTGILSLLFGSIAIAYYRQLLDPSSVRTRQRYNQSQSFPMQPGQYYPPPPQQQPGWMVPPYPGPPANQPVGGFEKGDYHPTAPWAQGEAEPLSYAPPSGPPPSGGFDGTSRGIPPNAAEDEAWGRAQAEGVTAHLTGHASAPPARRAGGEGAEGYTIRNTEEDEAWERAREQGVTAHLTGGGVASRRRDGEV